MVLNLPIASVAAWKLTEFAFSKNAGTVAALPEKLPPRVSSAKIFVPIFSRIYACGIWFLEARQLVVEHSSKSGRKEAVLPIFYDEERSDVKLDRKFYYRDGLDTHRRTWGAEQVDKWKKALVVVEAGKVKGWERRPYKSEEELITSVVREISLKLKIEHNYVPVDLFTGSDPMLSYRT